MYVLEKEPPDNRTGDNMNERTTMIAPFRYNEQANISEENSLNSVTVPEGKMEPKE